MSDYDGAMLAFGGGVNSVALAIILVKQGWHGRIVFADTGAEWPDTYCFMRLFEDAWLAPRGQRIVKLDPHDYRHGSKTADYRSLLEYCEEQKIIPLAAMRWCTGRWKIKPMDAYVKAHGLTQRLLGIDAGEAHRAQDTIRPLVDMGIDRKGCEEIIVAEGLPIPHKSGCFFCPFQRNEQWRELWKRYPDLFERAMRLEESASTIRRTRLYATLDTGGRITLRQRKLAYESQLELPGFDDPDLRAY